MNDPAPLSGRGQVVHVIPISFLRRATRFRVERPVDPIDMKPGRAGLQAGGRPVRGPRPRHRVLTKACFHWIEHYIARDEPEIPLALDHHRLKARFERVSGPLVPAIAVLRVDTVQLTHHVGQVVAGCVEEQVIVRALRHAAYTLTP
jgi:hypothetical protein